MKNKLSVWYWTYPKRYYLLRPWKWFRELGWNIRNAYQRATKGYCDIDWMNFDIWFKDIAPQMLRDMAMHGHGYPGRPPFEEPESWNCWLYRIANRIEECKEDDEKNEYYKEYIDLLMKENPILTNKTSPELKELQTKYQTRWEEINKQNEKLFKETMLEMLDHWDCLWD